MLVRKWQKNLEKQGATGAGNAIENRGNTNPSSVGVWSYLPKIIHFTFALLYCISLTLPICRIILEYVVS